MACINVQSLNCTRDLTGSQCSCIRYMARHDHDYVSQTQAEQRRSALSVTCRESTADKTDNKKFVHWLLMVGLLQLIQR